jgi:hypothetical protein
MRPSLGWRLDLPNRNSIVGVPVTGSGAVVGRRHGRQSVERLRGLGPGSQRQMFSDLNVRWPVHAMSQMSETAFADPWGYQAFFLAPQCTARALGDR